MNNDWTDWIAFIVAAVMVVFVLAYYAFWGFCIVMLAADWFELPFAITDKI